MAKATVKRETQREELEEVSAMVRQDLYITKEFLSEFTALKNSYDELKYYVKCLGEQPEKKPIAHSNDENAAIHLAKKSLHFFHAQAIRRDKLNTNLFINNQKSK